MLGYGAITNYLYQLKSFVRLTQPTFYSPFPIPYSQFPFFNMSLTRADLESSRLHQMISQSGLGMQLLSESQLQESIRVTLNSHKPNTDVWLFAYGSLIWNPAFNFIERRVGTVYGWHRRFCLRALVGRGTPEHPGLVLGLDSGGSCRGVVYRIPAADVESELLLLWRREMVIGSYIPRWVKVVDGTDEVMANRLYNQSASSRLRR